MRRFWPTLVLNVWSLILGFGAVEVALRMLATYTPVGPVVANVALLPKDWKAVAAQNQTVLDKAAASKTYLVFDSMLGWNVGKNRQSGDYNRAFQERYLSQLDNPGERNRMAHYQPDQHLYLSSAEGLRSSRAGASLASEPRKRRIALIGDSFTFGLEVPYEQTWGHQLERSLGPDFQVLNFGVDGHGVDQAFLRYRRDVRSWQPEVVILGIITDDLRRTMCVYGFLCFPTSEIPFPKPRFVLNADTLALLNQPLLSPDSVLAAKSISELPFITYDPAYDPSQWEARFYHRSFAVRFLLSRFPRWPVPAAAVSDQANRDINAQLIRSFARTAQENGSIPLVVYFPSREAFVDNGALESWGKQVLLSSGVPFIDTTGCVEKVPPAERFVIIHYSAATNAAVARCLLEPLERVVSRNATPS
jgi:hypothetical protein